MSSTSTVSPTQAIAGDNTSIAVTTARNRENLDDNNTLVATRNILSRPMTDWTPQSRLLRFYSTAPSPPLGPLSYVAGDPADWADVPQGGTNRGFFRDLLHFIISKIKKFFERLARMTFITPCH